MHGPRQRRGLRVDTCTLIDTDCPGDRAGGALLGRPRLRAGGNHPHPRREPPQAFPAAGPLDLPGGPTLVHTPGHTRGHCAHVLAGSGFLVTGDALVTVHPTSWIDGPQLPPSVFHANGSRALGFLVRIGGMDADVLLPGHRPVHRGSAQKAAETAREHAASTPAR
ncbi:MBL fold metallo-hydrolase [Streptomyces sp. NPDC003863]